PPTHFVSKSRSRIEKIVGVIFDSRRLPGDGEAAAVSSSATLAQVSCGARVVGDSAFPIANDGDYVLLAEETKLSQLEGDIVAVRTRADAYAADGHAYLKRLGRHLPSN